MTGCSKRQPKPQTEELPTPQTSSSSIYDFIDDFKPSVVYADIAQSPEPTTGNCDVHHKVTSNGAVLYSELQDNDNRPNVYIVAPSGDLYAQVQKRCVSLQHTEDSASHL